MNTCLFLKCYGDRAIGISRIITVEFPFVGMDEVYKRKADTRDELLACIFYASARINKHDDHLRRTTHDLSHTSCKVH